MIKLQIIGNLGADAELKEINGQNYISYSVCHTEKGKDGREFSTWVDVMMKAFDNNPRILPYLNKGTKVYVEGNPSVGAYVAKDGSAKGSLTLWSFKVELLGGVRNEANTGAKDYNYEPQSNMNSAPAEDPGDMPF